jgi:hypothetical protein
MKTYRFNELNHSAQIKAVYDYLIAWEDAHGESDLFFNEIYDILLVDKINQIEYCKKGAVYV